MPTVLRIGPYRFFFYANENGEPHHIHVQQDRMLAKFWLTPVSLARSTGFFTTGFEQAAEFGRSQSTNFCGGLE